MNYIRYVPVYTKAYIKVRASELCFAQDPVATFSNVFFLPEPKVQNKNNNCAFVFWLCT